MLDANPLDAIKNSTSIKYVMKNGEMFDAPTLDLVCAVSPDGYSTSKTSNRLSTRLPAGSKHTTLTSMSAPFAAH